MSKCHPCHPPVPTCPPSPRAGRCPPDPPRLVGKVHLQRHHPLRQGRLRIGGRRGDGLIAHAEACDFGHRSRHRTPISGSIKYRVLTPAKGRCECCGAGCCSVDPAPTGPRGGPHRAQEPGRLGRPQQPAGPLLPLQCRQAMGGARRERIAERMIGAAEHVRNSMLGSGQRTNRDEILIANRSETAA
jgi:hypothetical protein